MTRYRTFWPRVWAGFLDGLVLVPITYFSRHYTAAGNQANTIIVWAFIGYIAYWLYSVSLHAHYGQTLGKMAADIQVLDLSETRIPTLRQAFLRDIGYLVLNALALAYLIYLVTNGQYVSGDKIHTLAGEILAWAGLGWFLLEIFSMMTNDKRRALHDFIAGTVVVRLEGPCDAIRPPAARER